jgi:protein ATS1
LWFHTKMVTVYAIGSNGAGQLGIGHQEDVSVPKEALFDNSENPLSQEPPLIRAGGNHTLLLSGGLLYCSGDPSSGACGLLPEVLQPTPHFRKAILDKEHSNDPQTKIIFFAATWEASFVIKNNSHGHATQIYSFGTGNKGELGLGELIFRSPRAQLIKDFPPPDTEVVDVAASVSHVVVVLSNGDAYGWGNGRKGQLGEAQDIVYSPRKISDVGFKVVRAVCGREFTYLVSTPEDGRHKVLGTDKWNVMTGAPENVTNWKDIGASWGSIFVLFQCGELISWGRDDHGQLAPPNLPELARIAVGSEHALGLTAHGEVLAWGWGEHGNCGPSTNEGDVRGRWNIIASSKYLPAGSRILSIGSGCATSWISIGP